MRLPSNITREINLFRCPVCKAWVTAQVGLHLKDVEISKVLDTNNLTMNVILGKDLIGFGIDHRCGEVMMPDDDPADPEETSGSSDEGEDDSIERYDPRPCRYCKNVESQHAADGSCYEPGLEMYSPVEFRKIKDNPQA